MREIQLSSKAKDIRGQKFCRLTAIKPVGKKFRAIVWQCVCDCGAETTARAGQLVSGGKLSCGCLLDDVRSQNGSANKTHGLRNVPEYAVWAHMRQRCGNPNNQEYHNYGGRGISICDEWNSFEKFYSDMGCRPKGKTLDRIDNDGDYTPENCRWATPRQQAYNRRDCVMLTYKGETMPLGKWAEKLGMKRYTLANRIRLGWTVVRAFETPEVS